MKKMFTVKRTAPQVHTLYAHGYVDDTGNQRATIVLTVVAGSESRKARTDIQGFCDALNAVVDARYGKE